MRSFAAASESVAGRARRFGYALCRRSPAMAGRVDGGGPMGTTSSTTAPISLVVCSPKTTRFGGFDGCAGLSAELSNVHTDSICVPAGRRTGCFALVVTLPAEVPVGDVQEVDLLAVGERRRRLAGAAEQVHVGEHADHVAGLRQRDGAGSAGSPFRRRDVHLVVEMMTARRAPVGVLSVR